MAKTADGNALDRAAQMHRDGVPMETIRKETGWFTSKDQKWRFEIDDNKATFKSRLYLKPSEDDGDSRYLRNHIKG